MSDVLVSVMMPAYNHEAWVEQAVRSVWNQTHGRTELVVVDDGSTDRTFDIVRGLAAVSPIPMRVETQANRGPCATFNRCFELSSGELIVHLASDDYFAPKFIEENVKRYEVRGRGAVVLHSDAFRVQEGFEPFRIYSVPGKKPARGDAFLDIARGDCRIISSTVAVPRSVFELVGVYDETLRAEDFDMHLRQARVARFEFIDEPLFYSRSVPGSLGRRPDRWAADVFRALEKHRDRLGPEYPRIVASRGVALAAMCASHGQWAPMLRLAQTALASDVSNRTRTLAELARSLPVAAARGLALRRLEPAQIERLRTVVRTSRGGDV